ncbi:MAG: alpha/beta fold hydrolase, partial [Chloroflexi bacterium]|nr:alpha/beta fold hydrolase [Chloroflexota bacterium]
ARLLRGRLHRLIIYTLFEGTSNRSDYDPTEGIYIAVSNDGGSTFGSATKLSTSSSDYSHTNARVAVSGSNVFVIWKRLDKSLGSGFLYFNNMMFRRSTDGGISFQAEQNISGYTSSALTGIQPRLAASGSTVYVAWKEVDASSTLTFVKSSNSGESFGIRQSLDEGSGGHNPALAASGANVYIAWNLGFRRSSDSGANFQAEQTLDSRIDSFHNSYEMAADGDGVYVVWPDPNRTDLNIITSQDGGANFSTRVDISGAGDPRQVQPHTVSIASSAGGVYVAWADKNNEIMFRGPGTPRPAGPVVFVPGIAGSVLIDRSAGDREVWIRNLADWGDMSLFASDAPGDHNFLARDALRSATVVVPGGFQVATEEIYGPFLQAMADSGYHEYELVDDSDIFIPERLRSSGCDLSQDADPKPTLFIFPYDWRLDNTANASLLREYVACVRQFHPDTDVNIVAHSMGGLLARRYILQNPTDHHVNAYVSIGSPFLGAPKLIAILETGDFLDKDDTAVGQLVNPIFKHTTRSFPGAHQLLPSNEYFELGGAPPLVEGDRQISLQANGPLDYSQMVQTIDSLYGREGFTPGSTGDAFHQGGQDDWRLDTTGIKYHHIVGVMSADLTVGQVKTTWELFCVDGDTVVCSYKPTVELTLTSGDGTVPRLSADRAGTRNINAANAQVKVFRSPNEASDHSYSHNGMMSNPLVQQQVFQWLSAASQASAASGQSVGPEPAADQAPAPYHYITIAGAGRMVVSDSAGNNTDAPEFLFGRSLPGVDTFSLGSGVRLVTVPVSASTDRFVVFDSTDDPVSVEVRIGTGDTTTRSIRYQDLALPAGVSAKLSFLPSGPQDLIYDSDGDGTFESTVAPTVDVTGPAAADTDAPVITVREDIQGGSTRITLSAEDTGSGVARLLYSLDGANYQEYTGPLNLVSQRTPVLYAFADDNLANRSTLVHELRKNATPIPAVTWWGLGVLAILLIAVSGWRRLVPSNRINLPLG